MWGKYSGYDGFTDKTTKFRVKVLVFRVYWTGNIEIEAKCLDPGLKTALKVMIVNILVGKLEIKNKLPLDI